MSNVPDISETEAWIVRTTLKQRCNGDVELQYADAEIRLNPADRELISCPAFVWKSENRHFVIFKTGERRYRCRSFYRGYRHQGTSVHEMTISPHTPFRCCRPGWTVPQRNRATSNTKGADHPVGVGII